MPLGTFLTLLREEICDVLHHSPARLGANRTTWLYRSCWLHTFGLRTCNKWMRRTSAWKNSYLAQSVHQPDWLALLLSPLCWYWCAPLQGKLARSSMSPSCEAWVQINKGREWERNQRMPGPTVQYWSDFTLQNLYAKIAILVPYMEHVNRSWAYLDDKNKEQTHLV